MMLSISYRSAPWLIVAVFVLAGCPQSVDPSGRDGSMDSGVCRFASGRTCVVGASCAADDGCNTCRCNANGTLSCTLIGCSDSGGPGCRSNSDCGSADRVCVFGEGCSRDR